jgi:hypothetical protein
MTANAKQLRKRGSMKTWRENAQWDYSCDKDKRDQVPFVLPARSITFCVLFGGLGPGTIDFLRSSFNINARRTCPCSQD